MPHCVMVKGPCRGRNCDFWARIRLRKKSQDEILSEILTQIKKCLESTNENFESALKEYWSGIGIRNMDVLCQEEPDLCDKIISIEQAAKDLVKDS